MSFDTWQPHRDQVAATVSEYLAVYGSPILDGGLFRLNREAAEMSRTIRTVAQALPSYLARIPELERDRCGRKVEPD